MRRCCGLLVVILLGGSPVLGDLRPPEVPYETYPYEGKFTFARVRFDPPLWGRGNFYWGLDLGWNHDYPWAEQNLMKILDELTFIDVTMEGGNIVAADDPELFRYPLAYICEVGRWSPTDDEAKGLREYLLKGGFLIVDDFFDNDRLRGRNFRVFEMAMEKILPEARLIPIGVEHPIFQAFFRVDDLDFTHPSLPYLETLFFAIFENNDPTQRVMVIVNYNNDIGDYWEWSDQAESWYPIDLTRKGFQLGVNYILYALAH